MPCATPGKRSGPPGPGRRRTAARPWARPSRPNTRCRLPPPPRLRRRRRRRWAGSAPGNAAPGPKTLSARERELITLVAQGRTDAQIAAQLYISIRTVRSHLDRIRDKTGCRRRADLTRLALQAGLV